MCAGLDGMVSASGGRAVAVDGAVTTGHMAAREIHTHKHRDVTSLWGTNAPQSAMDDFSQNKTNMSAILIFQRRVLTAITIK